MEKLVCVDGLFFVKLAVKLLSSSAMMKPRMVIKRAVIFRSSGIVRV